MDAYVDQLTDVQKRLSEAVDNLREQQDLVEEVDCPQSHHALLMLLSNGLRLYYWLEDQDRRLREKIGLAPPRNRL
jgi:hypothetical protein